MSNKTLLRFLLRRFSYQMKEPHNKNKLTSSAQVPRVLERNVFIQTPFQKQLCPLGWVGAELPTTLCLVQKDQRGSEWTSWAAFSFTNFTKGDSLLHRPDRSPWQPPPKAGEQVGVAFQQELCLQTHRGPGRQKASFLSHLVDAPSEHLKAAFIC